MLKKIITIKQSKIFINSFELETKISHTKSSTNLVEVVNLKKTMKISNNEIQVFKNKECIINYKIEPKTVKYPSKKQYIHLFIRILNNYAVMIDGIIDYNPIFPIFIEKKTYKLDGIRFQPFILNSKNIWISENKGMGLFTRGLHFSGFITPSNYRLCCVCDECEKSFNIHSYHAGNGMFQYFYSDDGCETLSVPYYSIKNMPGQLCKNISKETVEQIDLELKNNGYEKFKFYNPFRCPYCKAPYIDFQRHPEIREYEYYANVFLHKEMIEYKGNT